MCLLLLVVVDAHEEQFAGVLRHLGGVLLAVDLVDGGVGVLVVFQFQDDGGGFDILAGQQHEVGKPFELRSNLLTLGRVQVNLTLLSLNRSFA